MRFLAILNRDGGTLRTMDLEAFCAEAVMVFARHGHELACEVVAGSAVDSALRQAAGDDRIDVILAAGGDGTISAAAANAFRSGKPFGVLPAGTMNLFARALQLPLDLHDALEAIAGGQVQAIDIATANGHPFVHQFGVGFHARLVRLRDGMTYRTRIGKMLATLRAIFAAAANPPRFEAEMQTPGGTEKRRVSGIAVSNNPLGEGHIHADRLDRGVLGIYSAAPVSTLGLLKLAAELLIGTWRDSPMVSEQEVTEVTLHFPRHKRGAQAVLDGELVDLAQTVTLKVHPGGLKVMLPVQGEPSARWMGT